MKFLCDAPGRKTWFRIETEMEAERESALMDHAVAKHFTRAHEAAARGYTPPPGPSDKNFERNIGLKAHVQRTMPMFLTLRDANGEGLATAMLPPGGAPDENFKIIIVGPDNGDPYTDHADAIAALGLHLGLTLEREKCFPYAG